MQFGHWFPMISCEKNNKTMGYVTGVSTFRTPRCGVKLWDVLGSLHHLVLSQVRDARPRRRSPFSMYVCYDHGNIDHEYSPVLLALMLAYIPYVWIRHGFWWRFLWLAKFRMRIRPSGLAWQRDRNLFLTSEKYEFVRWDDEMFWKSQYVYLLNGWETLSSSEGLPIS